MHELRITYFHFICKYFLPEEEEGMLGYPIQDYQCKIILRKSMIKVSV